MMSHLHSPIPLSQASEAKQQLSQDALLPAGGTDPNRFDWQEAWYPIHYIEDLDRSQLTTFTLLDQSLVIWWDATAESWRVFEDKCPHRLAPLSEGRVTDEGLLECPYHGWAFSGTGQCETIPQQPAGGLASASRRACARSLPTTVRQGLLFVYAGTPARADQVEVPVVDPLEEMPDGWVCLNTFRDLPYDALTLLENVLDSSHLPYTHHRSVGDRANAGPMQLEVLTSDKQGFQGFWEEGPRLGKLGSQYTTFKAPGLMWHDLTSKQFGRTLTVVYAVPIRKGECRLFARFPFKFPSKMPAFFIQATPRWYSHMGQNAILEDDQIFLHQQERFWQAAAERQNFAQAFYLPTGADRFVLEFHRWINRFQAQPFPGERLSLSLPKQQLLDRYHSHTIHCQSCRSALQTIQQVRIGLLVAVAIAWATLPLITLTWGQLPGILSTGLILLFGASWWGLGQLQRRFHEGRDVPPRNLPDQ